MQNPNTISLVNRLSANWANAFQDDQAMVGSGLGVWLLLATLLSGAEGEARGELEAATGLQQSEAAAAVATVLDSIDGVEGLKSAVAIWVRDSIELLPEFISKFPQIEISPLPDRDELLDEWASRATDGIIEKFPLSISPDSIMVLASALVAKGNWENPFSEDEGMLLAVETDLNKAAFIQDGNLTVSRVTVASTNQLDVHLIAGSRTDSPNEVLLAGMSELLGTGIVTPGDQLQDGQSAGCLSAKLQQSQQQFSELFLYLPQFQIETSHDLLEHREVFGFGTACDNSQGHFPGVSKTPLAVGNGRQSAKIAFGPAGFEAAAITVVDVMVGAAHIRSGEKSMKLHANFRWPFGFIIVHRETQLALFHGWVAESACKVSETMEAFY